MTTRYTMTVCKACSSPTLNGTYCVECAGDVRSVTRNRQYDDPAWRRARKSALAEHRAKYGNVCPGYNRPAHRSDDLTVDHPLALARGGALVPKVLRVLCRSCNSKKGTR